MPHLLPAGKDIERQYTEKTFIFSLRATLKRLGFVPYYRKAKKYFELATLFPLWMLASLCELYTELLSRLNPSFFGYRDYLATCVNNRLSVANYEKKRLVLYTPNGLTRYRANTFETKEPETLEWIDQYAKGGVLYDIGANVGIFSIYHAATQGSAAYAFEPSVFNLGLLVKNINANKLQDTIKVICNPLSADCGFASFNLPSFTEGGALNGFGVDYGHDGNPLHTKVSYETYGFSLDYLIASGALKEKPNIIKIDVDGIEHLILSGAQNTLRDSLCRSVLVEINDTFGLQASRVREILTNCGFTFKYRKRAALFDENGSDSGTYNHVWVKE